MTEEDLALAADAFGRSDVTRRIEDVRARAGRDAAALAAGAESLVEELNQEFPEWPFIASHAKSILGTYVTMARLGLLLP